MAEELIRTEALSRHYLVGGSTVQAVDGISLTIRSGELVAVMGPSGSGKSTLLSLLGCLERPSAGCYLLAGEDTTRLADDELAAVRNRQVGFVFQSFHLLPRATAVENVELPLIYADLPGAGRRDRARAALAQVGLEDRLAHRPQELSGGEQQRVAIARALVNGPSLILADEPTGALDSRTGRSIMELFRGLNQAGITVVVVTHDPAVARYAGRVVSLQDGRVVEDRPTAGGTESPAPEAGSP